MLRTLVFAALSMIAFSAAANRADPDVAKIKKALYIGIDGARFDAVRVAKTYLVDAPVTVLTHLGVEPDEAWKLDGRAVGLAQ